jgi:outer membrane protein assembly factor BamB
MLKLNSIIKNSLLISLIPALFACNGFFEKDNIPTPKPLVEFKKELKPTLLWSVNTKAGQNEAYLKYSPIITENTIFTISTKGIITATNRINGHQSWQIDTHLSSTAGLGFTDGLIIAAGSKGEILALQANDGRLRWKTSVDAEILASPAAQNGIAIIKTVNGRVIALSLQNGKIKWKFNQVEPGLILRAASSPVIQNGQVIVGFANGNIAKLDLYNGQLAWTRTVTLSEGIFPIQRMIDIDANPVVFQHHIYAATYQGKLVSLDWTIGSILWSQNISSYTGMAVNSQAVYLSDASSHIWAFNTGSGLVNWRQTELEWRQVTAPVLMENRYLVLGDAEGYVHWLDIQDGHVAAREFAGNGIYATPIVKNNILYIMTSNGYLLAYTLRK